MTCLCQVCEPPRLTCMIVSAVCSTLWEILAYLCECRILEICCRHMGLSSGLFWNTERCLRVVHRLMQRRLCFLPPTVLSPFPTAPVRCGFLNNHAGIHKECMSCVCGSLYCQVLQGISESHSLYHICLT